MRRPKRYPAALLALVTAALLLGLSWSVVTPPFQAPDENSHFGYLQHLVEAGELPGDASRPLFSTEQTQAQLYSNADQAAAQPAQPMELRRSEYERWQAVDERLEFADRADGGGANPAASNPPLYYLSVAPGYVLTRDASIFTRLWAARALSAFWLVLTVTAAWMLAREFFVDQRAAVFVAGLAALAPMITFLSGTVTPDAALFAVWTVALWLGVRCLRSGLTSRRAAALGAVVGAAILVKATSYALLPAFAFVLAVGVWRSRRILPALGAATALLAVVAPWFVGARLFERSPAAQVGVVTDAPAFNVRELASYVWQYYLPELPFMTPYPSVAESLPAYDLLIKGTVGAFGWLEIEFPEFVYLAAALCVLAVVGGLIVALVRRRRLRSEVIFLCLVALALMAGLHYSEYQQLEGGAVNFIQGRYLLPLVSVAGLAVVAAAREAPRRLSEPLLASLLAALALLNVWAMALVLERFSA